MAMVSNGGFLAYYRVSTQRQGKSGLGIEAQRQAVATYLNGGNWRIVGQRPGLERSPFRSPQIGGGAGCRKGAASAACGYRIRLLGGTDNQTHGPRRIGLRPRETRHGRERGSARCQMQKIAAGKFHFEPPSLHITRSPRRRGR